MRTPALHIRSILNTNLSYCGRRGVKFTPHPARVTCKTCRKIIETQGLDR